MNPARHNFALFRLVAFLWSGGVQPAGDITTRRAEPRRSTSVDRHQSTFETWTVMLWYLASNSCFVASLLHVSLPLAVVITVPLFQLVLFLSGLALWPIFRRITRTTMIPYRFNGALMMGIFIATAAYCATRPTWVRFAGRQVLAVVALNMVAAAIVFFLRGGPAFED